MKIVVNTRLLLKGKLDGIGWFTYETLRRITTGNPEHEFIFLFDRPWDPDFIFSPNVRPVVLQPPARHPFLWIAWLEVSVHRFLKKSGADLFLSPDGYLPLRTKTPCLAVIHDINFFHRPEDLPALSRCYYNYFFPRFARKAVCIATVSEYSAGDICRSYGIDRDKIKVIWNGANEFYRPAGKEEKLQIMQELTSGLPYFIFVGTMHPRKNIPNLLRAYDLFLDRYRQDHRLVLVGSKAFLTGEIDRVLRGMKHRDKVIFTGRLEPEKLARVLAAASALVFVPYIEGFGIPVIEAMRFGVPVIASDATSIPEIAGNAALMCGPDDVESIAGNMLRIAQDDAFREDLAASGLQRSALFSWDRSAAELWELIKKCGGHA